MVNKNYKQSKEHKHKIGLANKGRSPWTKGKPLPIEVKEKIRNTLLGYKPTEESRRKMSEARIGKQSCNKGKELLVIQGKNHWNWKGGITSLNHSIRTSLKAKIWRSIVFKRDNFTCQNSNCPYCHNKSGVELNAHHIKSFKLFPELVFKLSNGITYCGLYHLGTGLHKRLD